MIIFILRGEGRKKKEEGRGKKEVLVHSVSGTKFDRAIIQR
ncbi:hypothetical protein [Okeania sp. SIO2B3]|nr:hypothetical protein [Okeania sp. SIO2B3]